MLIGSIAKNGVAVVAAPLCISDLLAVVHLRPVPGECESRATLAKRQWLPALVVASASHLSTNASGCIQGNRCPCNRSFDERSQDLPPSVFGLSGSSHDTQLQCITKGRHVANYTKHLK